MKNPANREETFSYSEIGATSGELPRGYDHLVRRRVVGHGETEFRQASHRLMNWELQKAAGFSVRATTPRAEPGSRVLLGWGPNWLRASFSCEVVYVLRQARQEGFAYGTIHGHPEQGEERFCLDWRADDSVVLSITAFSRPGTWWSRLGAPVARRLQQSITERYLDALGGGSVADAQGTP